jgi:gliding motility-associated-like protein
MKWKYPISIVSLITLGFLLSANSFAQVPSAPGNVYVIGVDEGNELHWNANPGGESVTLYRIYRSTDNFNFNFINTATVLQYLDSDVENGKQYFYRITAVNVSGEGPNSVVDSGVPSETFGKFIRFNGMETDTVKIENSDELQLNGISFTIEFWLRLTELPLPGNEGYLIGRYTSANSMRYIVRVMPNGKLEFHSNSVINNGVATVGSIVANRWYHIAVTYIRTGVAGTNNAKFYINGIEDPGNKLGATLLDPGLTPGGSLVLGADPIATNRFVNGYMDEVRIWNVARSLTEISNNKCVRSRGDEPNLIGLWHFDEVHTASTPMIYDYTRNGNNGGRGVKTMVFTPVATNDAAIVGYNATSRIKVQQNDIGNSNTKLITTSIISGYPLHGTVNIINQDSISYTSSSGFSGVDTLKYVLADTASFCGSAPQYDTATVIVYTECNTKDELDWNQVPAGEKEPKTKYSKKGMQSTVSARATGGVSSTMAVGKKFKNRSSLEWTQRGGSKMLASDATISFNISADQFRFNIYDIDKEEDDVIDSLTVSAYSDGVLVNLSSTNIIQKGSAVNFIGNNSFIGIADVNNNTSDEGNITIAYFVPIDSVVMTFNNASSTAKPNGRQEIGIGNFYWCSIPNNAPVVLNDDAQPTNVITATTPFNEALRLCIATRDIDGDSVYVTQILPVHNLGSMAITAPDSCLIYTPKNDYIGQESFTVTWCDDRIPALCTEAEVIINVLPPPERPPFLISEAVSPNGDNILDYWIIQGIEYYAENTVKLYNIWGDLIFEQHQYNEQNAWRGESNRGALTGNQRTPDGTYYYIIDLGDGSPLLKGFVVLKR